MAENMTPAELAAIERRKKEYQAAIRHISVEELERREAEEARKEAAAAELRAVIEANKAERERKEREGKEAFAKFVSRERFTQAGGSEADFEREWPGMWREICKRAAAGNPDPLAQRAHPRYYVPRL